MLLWIDLRYNAVLTISPHSTSGFSQFSRWSFLAHWRLDFKQYSFNHIGQGLHDLLKVTGLSYHAFRRCSVHNSLSVVANYDALACKYQFQASPLGKSLHPLMGALRRKMCHIMHILFDSITIKRF